MNLSNLFWVLRLLYTCFLLLSLILVRLNDVRADDNQKEKFVDITSDLKKFNLPNSDYNNASTDAVTSKNSSWDIWAKYFDLAGSLRNEIAYRLGHPDRLSKFRNQLRLSDSTKINDDLKLVASTLFYYDSAFDFENQYSTEVARDQRSLFQLRDFYIDYSIGDFDFRVGKQQIVWGEAVGLFFTDIVNAKDYREFILQDFDLIRLPEWAIKPSYIKDNFTFEFIWLPSPKMNELAVPGSEFSFNSSSDAQAAQANIVREDPAAQLENSELGSRTSYLLGDFNFSLFYLYTWDKNGIVQTQASGISDRLVRDFERIHVIGTTFSKPLGEVILKGEFAYNAGSKIQVIEDNFNSKIISSDLLDYMIGLDFTFDSGLRTNTQFLQHVILNYENGIFGYSDPMTSYITFFASRPFFEDRFEPEAFVLTNLTDLDMMLRPSITYKISDKLKVKIGADLFHGHRNLFFGQFEKSSRVYSELNYYF